MTLRLEDEVDVSRGDMLVHPSATSASRAHVRRARRVAERGPARLRQELSLQAHDADGARRASTGSIGARTWTRSARCATPTLALNDIGRVTLTAHRALFVDAYETNRETGSFILIDSLTNGTVAAGMILGASRADAPQPSAGAVLVVSSGDAGDRVADAVEQRLGERDGQGVVLRGSRLASRLVAANAAANAGLVAIVAVDPATLEDPATRELLRNARAIVAHVSGDTIDAAAESALAVLRDSRAR